MAQRLSYLRERSLANYELVSGWLVRSAIDNRAVIPVQAIPLQFCKGDLSEIISSVLLAGC
ncbi:MAG: hypothetical protein JRN52_13440 [Nitrososphaerota archaeon]|nr:hypothetical protein [Nitrososphaerota archaeon]